MELGTRALSASEILDAAFDLVRRNALVLIGLAALIYLPLALLGEGIDPQKLQSDPVSAIGRVVPALLYGTLVTPIVSIALVAALAELARGRRAGFGAALRDGVSLLVPFAWASLLVFGLVLLPLAVAAAVALAWGHAGQGVAVIAIVVASLVALGIALRFLLLGQVVVIEGGRGAGALRRSAELIRGHVLRCFGILLLGGLLTGAIGWGVQLALGWLPAVGPLLVGLGQAVGVAYTSALGVVLYFDTCARRGDAPASAAPASPPPAPL